VVTDWDLYTRHGLHINLKDKEHIACKIIKTIKVMLTKKKTVSIKIKYKEVPERDNNRTEGETTTLETKTSQENFKKDRQSNTETENKQADTLNFDILGNRTSVRQRKAPKSLSTDFLW
jgi:hypothetical protein